MLRSCLGKPNLLLVAAVFCALGSGAMAADRTLLKVDINASGDARSITADGWEGWTISGTGTNGIHSRTFSTGVKVAFVSPWYSEGTPVLEPFFQPYYGAFCGDMLRVSAPAVNQGDIRCTLSNLSPGSYTFKSYHNPPIYAPVLNNLMDVNDRVGTDPWVKRYDNVDQLHFVPSDTMVLANPVVLNFSITQPGLDYQVDYTTRFNPVSLTDPNIPGEPNAPVWARNVGICGFEVVSQAIYAAYDPSPIPNSSIRYNTTYNFSWATPDTYAAGTQYYDLYFSTEPNDLRDPVTGEARFTGSALLVPHAVQSGVMTYPMPALVASKTYYWRVDSYGMKDGNPDYKTVGVLWSFNTNNQAPTLDLGPNQVTKQGRTVTLSAIATDLDELPTGRTITYSWTWRDDPNSNLNYSNDANNLRWVFPATTSSVSFMLDPNDAQVGTGLYYTFRCVASDSQRSTTKDIVVVCYNDSLSNCEINKKLANYQTAIRAVGDFNDDCMTDFKDLSIYVSQWLACKAINSVCQ